MFAEKVGVARREIVVDMALLEYCVREHLNKTAPRVMAVLDPVKVVIDNYPEGETEYMEIENNPEDVNAGVRKVAFARELFIERDDFMEDAPKKFFRLTPGQEVRLKGAYIIKCTGVDKDAGGNITLIHCTYDPESRSGSGTEASNRKVRVLCTGWQQRMLSKLKSVFTIVCLRMKIRQDTRRSILRSLSMKIH